MLLRCRRIQLLQRNGPVPGLCNRPEDCRGRGVDSDPGVHLDIESSSTPVEVERLLRAH